MLLTKRLNYAILYAEQFVSVLTILIFSRKGLKMKYLLSVFVVVVVSVFSVQNLSFADGSADEFLTGFYEAMYETKEKKEQYEKLGKETVEFCNDLYEGLSISIQKESGDGYNGRDGIIVHISKESGGKIIFPTYVAVSNEKDKDRFKESVRRIICKHGLVKGVAVHVVYLILPSFTSNSLE